jgi:hypothetical protein
MHRVDRVTVQRAQHEQAQRIRDLELSIHMQKGRSFTFRGRHYGVPPIPWRMVLRILALGDRLDSLGKHPSEREWKAVHREAMRIFKVLARPKDPLERLFWPFINPLSRASHAEVATLLSFTFKCLATDCGMVAREESPLLPSTSPSSTDASPTTSQPGVTRRATRVAGRTST